MSDFEFLSVLVSIVIGLSLTHLLAGLGRAFYARQLNRLDPVHVAWTITIFFVLVLNWWVFLLWRDFEQWTFPVFFTTVVWTTSLYMLTIILYPPNLPEDTDYHQLFQKNRNWFLMSFLVMCALDLAVTYLREGRVPEAFYIRFVGHYMAIACIGLVVRTRWYDLLAAWYITLSMASWSFVIRNTLA